MSRVWLLPGMDGTGELFGGLAHALAHHDVRVVRYDGDDHDAIGARLPAALRDGEASDVLVAESYGGALALRLAARRPFAKVVLVASFVSAPWPVLPAGLAASLHPPPRLAIRLAMLGLDAPAPLVDEVAAAIASVPAGTMAARIRSLRRLDARAELRDARAEVVWIRAAHDRLVPPRATDVARAARPDLRVHVLDGPHLLAQRAPEAVARAAGLARPDPRAHLS